MSGEVAWRPDDAWQEIVLVFNNFREHYLGIAETRADLSTLMTQSRAAERALPAGVYARVGEAALLLDQLLDVLRGDSTYYAGRDPDAVPLDPRARRETRPRPAHADTPASRLVDAALGLNQLISTLHLLEGALQVRREDTASVLCSIDKVTQLRDSLANRALPTLEALSSTSPVALRTASA